MNNKRKHGNFSHELKSFYKGRELDSNQLARLQSIAMAAENNASDHNEKIPNVAVPSTPWWRHPIVAPLLSAAIALLAGIWIASQPAQISLESIRKEVVKNHLKRLPMDIETSNVAAIAEKLDRLDFALVTPELGQLGQHQVIGGRYCSIGGNIAAQLKIERDGGKFSTLYITAATPIENEMKQVVAAPFQSVQDGVQVKLWKENDLIYVLATESLQNAPSSSESKN